MPSFWTAGVEGTILVDDVDTALAFNRASTGTPYDDVPVEAGHYLGKSQIVPLDGVTSHFFVESHGHYLAEFNNTDPETRYRVVYPIGRGIKGRVWGVELVVGAFSHREILDADQEATFDVYWSTLGLNPNPIAPEIWTWQCRVPVDSGPGSTYSAKARAFDVFYAGGDKVTDYPLFNVDSLCDGLGLVAEVSPVEERVFSSHLVVEFVGSPDLADVERRILGVETKYDRM